MQQRPIFRQVALERLSSPEQLDQLMQVTTPRGWLALLALLGLIITVGAWSVSDTIPTEVVGQGILLRGGRVLSAISPATGQVDEILVAVGDEVEAGQVIARVRPMGGEVGPAVDVLSPNTGRVAEMSVGLGSVVQAGASVAFLEDSTKPLEAVVYMPASRAKNIQPGMAVQVTPTNISREEYGFIRGRVRSVATFPSTFQAMMLVLGNEQLVQEFLVEGTPIEVRIDLETDPNTPSGFAWSSSSGPAFPINSGSLCVTTITLEEQRPINLVFPTR